MSQLYDEVAGFLVSYFQKRLSKAAIIGSYAEGIDMENFLEEISNSFSVSLPSANNCENMTVDSFIKMIVQRL